ncbi:hypothetical protein Tco_1150209, partial [Tanacetum coccineum]
GMTLVKSFIEMCEPNTKYNWERIRIMPPTMTTRSVGWPAAASRGGGTGGWARRGGGRTRGRPGDQGDDRMDGQGGQVAKIEVKEMVGIKTEMPSITTSRVMLVGEDGVSSGYEWV